jgi:hypothetical protein
MDKVLAASSAHRAFAKAGNRNQFLHVSVADGGSKPIQVFCFCYAVVLSTNLALPEAGRGDHDPDSDKQGECGSVTSFSGSS